MENLDEELLEEFKELSEPLMIFLKENFHPHVRIVVEADRSEIVEGIASVVIEYENQELKH